MEDGPKAPLTTRIGKPRRRLWRGMARGTRDGKRHIPLVRQSLPSGGAPVRFPAPVGTIPLVLFILLGNLQVVEQNVQVQKRGPLNGDLNVPRYVWSEWDPSDAWNPKSQEQAEAGIRQCSWTRLHFKGKDRWGIVYEALGQKKGSERMLQCTLSDAKE